MRHFDIKLMVMAVIAVVSLSSIHVRAAGFEVDNNSRMAKVRQEVKQSRPFRGQTPWGVLSAGLRSGKLGVGSERRAATTEPTKVFDQLTYYDFLEVADGTVWFYTSEYDIEYKEISEWYTEENIVGYTFTIYNSSFQEVGKIKDKVTLGEGETKVAHAVLDPAVSAKFFNTDDKYEVMVYLAMNTSTYDVHYYNKVYSIGGEKDADGNDICIATMPGRCADVCNAAADGNEDCYYTFVDDIDPDPSDYDFDDFLDWLNDCKTQVTVYSKATGGEGPVVFLQKDIYRTRYPGDTTEGIYMITKVVNGTPYFIFSQYEKPYFVDPTGMATDESATEDNSLVIEVYGGKNLVSTTKIPVEIKKVEGELNYTFYSIGSVAWKDDIDMSVNGTPQAPAFLVARDFTKASNLEEVVSSYDIYGNDGKLVRNLAADTDGIILMGTIEGLQPQALFVNVDNNNQYTFNFIDLYSGEKVLSQPYQLNNNPDDQLTASCQRVVVDDFGSYQYAFEMLYDEQDADGNDIRRIAWINRDGSLDRIDKINMGKDVMAAAVNMYANCLSPYLYDTDDAMEYAVLVKRATGDGTTKNEFLVVDDNGEWYAHFSEADGKGSPMVFTILPDADINRLQMVYRADDNTYHIDIYDLPFSLESASVKETEVGSAGAAISFNGISVLAAGAYIEVYNTAGVKVATGNDAVSLDSMAHGVYIAIARDAQGNSSILKFTF